MKEVIQEALTKSKGAKFYKCALQVNPASYAQYQGKESQNEEEYNQNILEACKRNGIEVVGLADHGNVNSSDNLRKKLSENEIIVFPGFEICSTEKVHMVCLFPSDYTWEKLNQILGAIQGGAVSNREYTYPSNYSVIDIADIVEESKGIWYAAHIIGENGLLRLNRDGGGLDHIWKDDKRVIAGQIPNRVDDIDQKLQTILKNQDPNYKRNNPISLINASDVESPETLDKENASCLIKMSSPTIEALKQAFLDGESRIKFNSKLKEEYHSRIEAMAIDGGFLDGLRIHFNRNLNTLIGGRGTGKSTVLECLRYAFDKEPKSEEAGKKHNQLVEENLQGGRITVQLYSHELNKTYIVERHYNQPFTLFDQEGNVSNLSLNDIVPYIEIFGQNEIYDIAQHTQTQLSLLNRFLPSELPSPYDIKQKLKENRNKLISAIEKKDEVETEVSQLSKLKEQQNSLKEFGLEEKFNEAEKYEQENNRIIKRTKDELDDIQERTAALESLKFPDLDYLSDKAIEELPNKDIAKQHKKAFQEFSKKVTNPVDTILKAVEELKAHVDTTEKDWQERKEQFEKDLQKTIEQLPDMAGKSGKQVAKEYKTITRKIASIQSSEKTLKKHDNYVKSLKEERKKLLSELDDIGFKSFQAYQKVAQRLSNKLLKGKLQIKVIKDGERTSLKNFLKKFQGISDKKTEWVDSTKDLNIRQLTADIVEGKEVLLEKYRPYGMTESMADTLIGMSKEDVFKLEELLLEPSITIEMNIGRTRDNYKKIEHLSTGQKCTAILHLLMIENKDPLIVDQPEDNLDNAFIAERIVRDLRSAKEQRQFIFSTHNANIPVFGDSEWIGVLEASEEAGFIRDKYMGSIDNENLRIRVEDILEGGKQAFEIRRLKYGF